MLSTSSIIQILPEHVASKIAAGEVVNRPSSVIKELVENSLDAGATTVEIIIKEGGKSLIEIIDNGWGMNEDDALLAFQRHATSKISSFEDLEYLHSFGFRGEALGSVSAVAQVELWTRQKESDVGILIKNDGGNISTPQKVATEIGTKIWVRNLFFNTPARKNFLKSNSTEFKHIHSLLQKLALAFPSVRFTFTSDDEEIFNLPAQPLPERLNELFGENLAENILPVAEGNDVFSVQGFISKPNYFRKTQTEQFFFLNKRIIQSKNLSHAVFQGYEQMLEKGTFPFFALFLTIDPKRVDVNVHPSKMEVKFDDERGVYRTILTSVKKTLGESEIIPTINLQSSVFSGLGMEHIPAKERAFPTQSYGQKFTSQSGQHTPNYTPPGFIAPFKKEEPGFFTQLAYTEEEGGQVKPVAKVVHYTQVHNQYITAETVDGIVIIDQHAAHERVLYEKYQRLFEKDVRESQQLLFPLTIELLTADALIVTEMLPNFERLGFQLKFFGKTTLIIEGLPSDVRVGKETNIFREVFDTLKEELDLKIDAREALIKTFSCKAAIKKGDPLLQEEMRSLVEQLSQTQIPHVCPHGRPVTLQLTLRELDRKFGRI